MSFIAQTKEDLAQLIRVAVIFIPCDRPLAKYIRSYKQAERAKIEFEYDVEILVKKGRSREQAIIEFAFRKAVGSSKVTEPQGKKLKTQQKQLMRSW